MNWVVSTIVVPSDGSADVDAQLASARALARATGARIVVVHVNELVRGHLGVHSLHACEEQLETAARRQVEELRNLGVRAELELVASAGDLADVIIEVARKRDADLIVARRSRNRPTFGVLNGGVARRLVRLAPCPVLVVPRPAQRPSRAVRRRVPMAGERSSIGAAASV
jgi:nucleotide-binding universal stress UspA family protein